NLDVETGVIYDGTLFFEEDNFHITGNKIEKLGKDTYRIIDGSFTTCDDPSPPWKFTGKEIRVTLEGYATAKHVAFYLKDIPVLYFPYMIYPAKAKRQTGFLVPTVGYSDSEGGEMKIPFYWAVAKNVDATFSLDYRSKRGVGEEIEYRHVFSSHSSLNLHLYHMHEIESYREWEAERTDEDIISDPDRWRVDGRYEHYFDPSFAVKADFSHVSDRDFYRDFGKTTYDRSQEKEESTVFIAKVWEGFSLNSELRYTEDLTEDNDYTLQRLPRIEFVGSKRSIFNTPLFYSMTSTFDSFWREEGTTGERVDIYPEILYTFHTDYFEVGSKVGMRETAYNSDEGEERIHTREIYDVRLELSETFQRIFQPDGERLNKLKHSVRPEVEYTYIPDVNQDDLPEFNSQDRINENSSITYSLTNELIGKLNGITDTAYYHKFARFKLSQTYDFIEARRSLESSSDSRRPLSPLYGELDIYPNAYISMELDGAYDTYEDRFTTYNVLMGLKDKRGDSLGLEYRFTEEILEEIHTNLTIKVVDSLDFNIRSIHSEMDNKSLETVFGLEYTSQCWGVRVTYSDLAIEEEDRREKEYMVTFLLLGVGEFGLQ
ncbi:MAG: LPS assembly protein LptD, partial [Thermodesulfobacteriota bacterium]|nr:LPS assembly protein LptD [Thermodesulfobacteriota bacterium]